MKLWLWGEHSEQLTMYLKIDRKFRSSWIRVRICFCSGSSSSEELLKSFEMFNSLKGSSDSCRSFKTYSYLSDPIFCFTNSVARWPLAGDTGFLGLNILLPSKVKYFDWFCYSNFCLKLSWGVLATCFLIFEKGLWVVGLTF